MSEEMNPELQNDPLRDLVRRDHRYALNAYLFVFEALDFTIQRMGENRHVTGQELLVGIRDYAKQQFGYLARMVFPQWGIRATDDFGEIVFNLVNAGLMGKTETDTKEDFKNGYDFEEVFTLDSGKKKS